MFWETLTLGDGTVIDGGILTFPQYLIVSASLLLIRGTKESASINNV
jgi:APA family basic amino acid/polyamine antiporter